MAWQYRLCCTVHFIGAKKRERDNPAPVSQPSNAVGHSRTGYLLLLVLVGCFTLLVCWLVLVVIYIGKWQESLFHVVLKPRNLTPHFQKVSPPTCRPHRFETRATFKNSSDKKFGKVSWNLIHHTPFKSRRKKKEEGNCFLKPKRNFYTSDQWWIVNASAAVG
jgi:hypothetical protein